MEPSDFLNGTTVYRYEQVITRQDLVLFADLLELQYEATLPKNKEERAHILTAIKTIDTLLGWLVTGKQNDFRGLL